MATESNYDLLVVGGGINGVGIARDAAGRGLKVALCEQYDIAAATSSSSTKLIHGGLRYLEYYDFGLVRKSLHEREVVLASAPHVVWPLRFVLPHDSHLRPAWMIRAGLFLYDHLAKRRLLTGSSSVDLRKHEAGKPLDSRYTKGFVYSDAWVEDARLVVLNAMDARERGATILPRTKCTSIRRSGDHWTAELTGMQGAVTKVTARVVVNAAGPWVDRFLREATTVKSPKALRLVKGSHVIVPKLFDHPYAYIFQSPDGRIVFGIPFERDFTLVGTTEVDFEGDPAEAKIDEGEVDYLLQMVKRYFARTLTRKDVVWTYSGVRPLINESAKNATAVTRDYSLELDEDGAPLLSVFGGKLTTYRKLAEEVLERLAKPLGLRDGTWTAGVALPGGDMPDCDFEAYLRTAATRYAWLPAQLLRRYARAYGTRIDRLLKGASGMQSLGEEVLPGLFAREIDYLRQEEWAMTAADILWRRSKLGLHLPAGSEQRLDEWLARHPSARPTEPAEYAS